MPSFIVNLLKDTRVWIAVLLVGYTAVAYHIWQENKQLRSNLEMVHALSAQNVAALHDSLTREAARVQTLSVRVVNLNDSLGVARKEYRVLVTKYVLLVASGRDSGVTIASDGTDSTGAYRQVLFSGRKSIAHYSGFTRAYLTPLSRGMWDITFEFDTVRTQSELVFDKDSHLFNIRTTSLTPGVTLLGYSSLDSAAYPVLYRGELPLVVPPRWLYVGGTVGYDFVAPGAAVRVGDWMFLLEYQVFNRLVVESQPWYNRVQFGVYYSPF